MSKSLIYEVNIDILKHLASEFEEWLEPHIEEVLKTGHFLSANSYKRESEDSKFAGYSIHYFAKSESDLKNYLELQAPRLRREAIDKFKDNFSATRRVLRSLAGL